MNIYRVLRASSFAAVLAASLGPAALPGFAQTAGAAAGVYEGPPVMLPKEALPADLVAGPDHRVVGFVYNDGAINRYTVNTSHGELIVSGTALLQLRIRELAALQRLRALERAPAYEKALQAATASPLRSAKPVVLGVGSGDRRGMRAVDPFFGAEDAEDAEATPDTLKIRDDFESYKRRFAYAAGVNPYSRLEALQRQMNEMAWTYLAGGVSSDEAAVQLASITPPLPPRSRFDETVFQRVRDETPAQLKARNTEMLTELGIDESVARVLQSQTRYTPVAKTAITEALRQMKGVDRPSVFVERAALIKEPAQAERIERWAQALAAYHHNVEPVARFVRLGDSPFLQTADGKVVGVFEVDLLVWTPQTARVVDRATEAFNRVTNATSKELWFVNAVTPMTRTNLEQRGWRVVDNARAQLTLE